ncbi:MAG: nitrous oxide reductase accessory protein NosL [Flavobacteriales bacterium]|nr:nitrous oxide reductase accessory protein NosL [Flavobacteriales bacterium]MBK9287056.1 nitrous oxide reductase accessory protein NosL [Flavobacteriales bacterium]
MTFKSLFLLLLPLLGSFVSCGQPAPHIDYGKAECAHCRMNVVDQRFAAVLITKSGRQYVFDGPECMVPYVAKGAVSKDQIEAWYVSDHAHPGTLMDANTAFFVHGPAFRSPMRGDVAAFATAAERDRANTSGGEVMDWEHVKLLLQQ